MVSATAFDPIGMGNDPMRLAAQVLSGIGFLGAGTIIRDNGNIKGLTTAASLWICASIGLAIGSGLYFFAAVAAVITILALTVLNNIDEMWQRRQSGRESVLLGITVVRDMEFNDLRDIESLINERNMKIKNINVKKDSKSLIIKLDLDERDSIKDSEAEEFIHDILSLDGIQEIDYKKRN